MTMDDAHPSPEMKIRGLSLRPNGFLVLLAMFFVMLTPALCAGREGSVSCDSHTWSQDGFGDFIVLRRLLEVQESFPRYRKLENVCSDSKSFCFPSTLIGLEEISDGLPLGDGKMDESDGVGFCRGPALLDSRSKNPNGFPLESSSSAPFLEINPPSLDWGMGSLLSPTLVYLTMVNTHNSSVLHVFEPFSTNEQFYAYSFDEFLLAPGEAGVITFVFLPRMLGSMSAQVVLQTNFGDFVVQCKGIGIESPYGVEPFGGFDMSIDGKLTWNLSLYNPFHDGLYVKEVSAQVSVYTEDTSHSDVSICSIEVFHQPLSRSGPFCKASEIGLSWTENISRMQWEIPPQSTETILKVSLWPPIKGKVSGSICVELWNSARDKFDTVVVPLEAEVDGRASYNSLSGSVSVFFESLVTGNGRGMICSLSLRNSASQLLNVLSITESSKNFDVKYMKGLLLYPGSITQAALISYNPQIGSWNSPTKSLEIGLNCNLAIISNDSVSPQIMVPCLELLDACFRHEVVGGPEGSYNSSRSQEEKEQLTNARMDSLEGIIKESLPLKPNFTELLEADHLILRNWKSQGTMSKLSVLKDPELLFPVVQIGTQFSKWITVHNPSQKYVVMQLLLNSGTIIDQCKFSDDSFNPLLVNISTIETQDGFSIPESATTEALVHPFGSALFGPIFFFPSKKCTWRSSALVRNNLSGIEWLPLRAFGGSYSLLLLQGSELVRELEFNIPLPVTLNLSSPDSLFKLETTSKSCDHQLYKELYAKNAGELPLEVMKLEVSGNSCGLDGFMIHTCKGFSLEPGQSVRLLVSYQPDFSEAVVLRDLNLITFSGVLVIPMKAHIPFSVINLCKKSLFWTAIWKFSALMLAAISIVCLLFILLHPISIGTESYSVKSENNIASISKTEKSSRIHRNARNAKSIKKDEKSEEDVLINRYSRSRSCVQESTQKMKKDSDQQKKTTSQSPPSTKMPVIVPEEVSGIDNLTVKVVKERGRRRKKRAGIGGLISKFEVSSSQSGNSTPSSPMSPNAFTPNSSNSSFPRVFEDQNQQTKHEFGFLMEAAAPEPKRSGPVLLPSASFPPSVSRAPGASTSSLLVSTSPIAPYARAPGSKLSKEKTTKSEGDDDVFGKKFTYDIWGNHFCDHLMGKPKVSSKVFDASEDDSQSFFARDPQSLMMMSSAQSVSPGHKSPPPYDVNYLHE